MYLKCETSVATLEQVQLKKKKKSSCGPSQAQIALATEWHWISPCSKFSTCTRARRGMNQQTPPSFWLFSSLDLHTHSFVTEEFSVSIY